MVSIISGRKASKSAVLSVVANFAGQTSSTTRHPLLQLFPSIISLSPVSTLEPSTPPSGSGSAHRSSHPPSLSNLEPQLIISTSRTLHISISFLLFFYLSVDTVSPHLVFLCVAGLGALLLTFNIWSLSLDLFALLRLCLSSGSQVTYLFYSVEYPSIKQTFIHGYHALSRFGQHNLIPVLKSSSASQISTGNKLLSTFSFDVIYVPHNRTCIRCLTFIIWRTAYSSILPLLTLELLPFALLQRFRTSLRLSLRSSIYH